MLKRNDSGEAALEFYDKRRRWIEWLSTMPGLTDRAFRVGYWLAQRMNGEDQCCWYSVPRIAKEMGKSERYVRYAIAELRGDDPDRKIGWQVMLVVETPGKPNSYHLRAPFF